jgi:hypothetical protein
MSGPAVPDRRRRGTAEEVAAPDDRVQRSVWLAVDDTPTTVETVLLRTDLSLSALTAAGEELVEQGLLTAGAGWWARA